MQFSGGKVGFAHGVMNTDNLSLLGITVDLNVFGLLPSFDCFWGFVRAFGEGSAFGCGGFGLGVSVLGSCLLKGFVLGCSGLFGLLSTAL